MTNYIWITTQKEMFHRYPDAPNEVSFLKNEHRHIFKFRVSIEIYTDDRDIEFIMFKREVDKILDDLNKNLEHKSCEMISDYINDKLIKTYLDRKIIIEVSEDGENGSLKEYENR